MNLSVTVNLLLNILALISILVGLGCGIFLFVDMFRDELWKGIVGLLCSVYMLYYGLFEWDHEHKWPLFLGWIGGYALASGLFSLVPNKRRDSGPRHPFQPHHPMPAMSLRTLTGVAIGGGFGPKNLAVRGHGAVGRGRQRLNRADLDPRCEPPGSRPFQWLPVRTSPNRTYRHASTPESARVDSASVNELGAPPQSKMRLPSPRMTG